MTPLTLPFFSWQHLVIVGVCALMIIGLVALQPVFKSTDRYLGFLIVLMVSLEVFRQIWYIVHQHYDVSFVLPFHLCGLQIFLMPWMYLSKKEGLKSFVYYAGVIGGVLAIVFNDSPYPLTHVLVFQSYMIHTLILSISLIMVRSRYLKVTSKGWAQSAVMLLALIPILMIVNQLTQGNYMYVSSMNKPGILSGLTQIVGWFYIPLLYGAVVAVWFGLFKLTLAYQRHCLKKSSQSR